MSYLREPGCQANTKEASQPLLEVSRVGHTRGRGTYGEELRLFLLRKKPPPFSKTESLPLAAKQGPRVGHTTRTFLVAALAGSKSIPYHPQPLNGGRRAPCRRLRLWASRVPLEGGGCCQPAAAVGNHTPQPAGAGGWGEGEKLTISWEQALSIPSTPKLWLPPAPLPPTY